MTLTILKIEKQTIFSLINLTRRKFMITSENNNMKLSVTEKEYIAFFLYMRVKSNIFILICGFFLYIILFYVLLEITLFMNILISAAIITFIVIPLIFFGLVYKAKKEYRSNSGLQKEIIVKFSDLGFYLTTPKDNNYREWNSLYAVREIKNGFILYYSAYSTTLFPKRCFNSEKDIDFFKERVLTYLNPKSVHLKD